MTIIVPRVPLLDESYDLIKAVSQRVNGSKLCLLKPDVKELYGIQADANARAENNFTRMASSWFGMDVFSSKRVSGVTADFFLYMEPPPTEYLLEEHGLGTKNMDVPLIVISPNAFESATLKKDAQNLENLGRTIEIISQPCGPAKFAKAIERCLNRGSSDASSDVDSPESLEGNRQGITPAVAEASDQAHYLMSAGTALRLPEGQRMLERRTLSSQSGFSGPNSDTATDTIVELRLMLL